MVLAVAAVRLGEDDRVAANLVDRAEMLVVRTDDVHMLAHALQKLAHVFDGSPKLAATEAGLIGILGTLIGAKGLSKGLGWASSLFSGAAKKEVLQAALGRAFKLLAFGSVAGLLLGILATRVLAFIVYQATPRDPVVLAGVVLAMMLLGLLATWIPARRAL